MEIGQRELIVTAPSPTPSGERTQRREGLCTTRGEVLLEKTNYLIGWPTAVPARNARQAVCPQATEITRLDRSVLATPIKISTSRLLQFVPSHDKISFHR